MAANDDTNSLLIAAGLLGLGVLGASVVTAKEQRDRFHRQLKLRLREQGLELVSAELGRLGAKTPVWFVTIDNPAKGLQNFRADFDPDTKPYADKTLEDLVQRLLSGATRPLSIA
ncbi:MAG: hypothetical protein H6739_39505 [Alphaproteobacteria bacterium]|nr:hypothetical protein [Alphaproteobacteria bacterium]